MTLTLVRHGQPAMVCEGADLRAISSLESAAGGESPTLTVTLDPARIAAVAALDPPPLRARATLSEGDALLFTGLVQAVRLGPDPSLTLES